MKTKIEQVLSLAKLVDYADGNYSGVVYNSWLRSYRSAQPKMTDTTYYAMHKKVIDNILSAPDASIKLMCCKDNPDQVWAYIVSEKPGILHYVYVKQPYRHLGIANYLLTLEGFGEEKKFTTHACERKWQRFSQKYKLLFNPYLQKT